MRLFARRLGVMSLLLGLVCTINSIAPSRAAADLFAIEDADSFFAYDSDFEAVDQIETAFGVDFVNFQYGEGWMLRVAGSTTELLGGVADIDSSGTFGTITFAGVTGFDVVIGYSIEQLSLDEVALTYDATITNVSGAPVGTDVTLYSYFDYDIDDIADGHFADITEDAGVFTMDVELPGVGVVTRSAVDADHWEIDEFAEVYDHIIAGLDLTDSGAPFGPGGGAPGDFTGGFQWDFFLEDGESATVSGDVFASKATAVPEPSTVALLGVAGLIVAGRRLRKRLQRSGAQAA